MNDLNTVDRTVWDDIVGRASELQDDPDTCEHLVYRFLKQYLPALYRAKTQEARDRVWSALWSYLVSPPTRAKPFVLSSSSADDLIAEIQEELSRRV